MALSTLLKEATTEAHRRAESGDLQRRLVAGTISEGEFGEYLGQLWCIHRALEGHFESHRDLAEAVGWSEAFCHSRRLEQDLTALGIAVEGIEPCDETVGLLNVMAARIADERVSLIGFFYVLEGSMNGNRFIAKALSRGPLAGRCDLVYFDPYGDRQMAHWKAVKEALDSVPLTEAQQAIVLEAALAMFAAIGDLGRAQACA